MKAKILKALKTVLDPELGISIVDLGLVYDVKVKENQAEILITLTTIGCPLFPVIRKDIEDSVKLVRGIDQVKIELTFDPPWNPDKMTKEGKTRLGFL